MDNVSALKQLESPEYKQASLLGSAATATAAGPRPLFVETILNMPVLPHTMYS